MSEAWYAAHTRPLGEYAATRELNGAGWEAYLPAVRSPQPRTGHGTAPLFPSYLFVRCDLTDREGTLPIFRLSHVLGLVVFDGEAIAVPDDVIDALRERVDAFNGGGSRWARFKIGDRVRVPMGNTISVAEIVEEAKSPDSRVRVLLEFMGRQVEAQVPWRDVHPDGALPEPEDISKRPPRRTRGRGRFIKGYAPA